MTTSNDPVNHPESTTPSQPAFVSGQHWDEISATLSAESTACLSDWIDSDLADLEQQFGDFVTNHSLKKSLRR